MERQTGLETAHYGRRMREECGGSGLLDTINIGSDRIGSEQSGGEEVDGGGASREGDEDSRRKREHPLPRRGERTR